MAQLYGSQTLQVKKKPIRGGRYRWSSPPLAPGGAAQRERIPGTATTGRGRMPDAPLTGNGDLGVSVGANLTAGEITLYLGLNQMWFINAYMHWNYTHADEVAPRRIGFGGVTIRAPALASVANFTGSQDMAKARLTASLGPLKLQLTLSEEESSSNGLVMRLHSTTPLDVEVEAWILPLERQCGQDIEPLPCYSFDGSTSTGIDHNSSSIWATRTPFSAFVAKPISSALAVRPEPTCTLHYCSD